MKFLKGGGGNEEPPDFPHDKQLDKFLAGLTYDKSHITKKGAAISKDIREGSSTIGDFLAYCEKHTITDIYSKVAEVVVLRKAIAEAVRKRAPVRVERIHKAHLTSELLQEEEGQEAKNAKLPPAIKRNRRISEMAWLGVGCLISLAIGIGQIYLLLIMHSSPFMIAGSPLAGAASWPFGTFISAAFFERSLRQRFPHPRHQHNLTIMISSFGLLAALMGLFLFSQNYGWLGAEPQNMADGKWLTATFLSLDAIAGEFLFSALIRTYLAWREESNDEPARAEEAMNRIKALRRARIEEAQRTITDEMNGQANDAALLIWAEGGLGKIEARARVLVNKAVAHGLSVHRRYEDFDEE